MWESVGFIIAFGYSNELCTSVKMYVLMGVLIVGFIGYVITEYLENKHSKAINDKAMESRKIGYTVENVQSNVSNGKGESGIVYENNAYKSDHDTRF